MSDLQTADIETRNKFFRMGKPLDALVALMVEREMATPQTEDERDVTVHRFEDIQSAARSPRGYGMEEGDLTGPGITIVANAAKRGGYITVTPGSEKTSPRFKLTLKARQYYRYLEDDFQQFQTSQERFEKSPVAIKATAEELRMIGAAVVGDPKYARLLGELGLSHLVAKSGREQQ
jgi:hypothetical protein